MSSESAASPSTGPPPGPEPGPARVHADFAVATRRFLEGQITLADSKAGVLLTLSVMVLAYLVRVGSGTAWQGSLGAGGAESLLAVATLVGLGGGLVGALAVVVPRTRGRPEGLVFWRAILEFETPRDYAEAVTRLDAEAVATSVLEDCHRLSALCARKFAVLRWALWAASLGLLAGLAWLLLYS